MAAGGIRGITIEIGGDTTKLDKALTGVNKNARDIQRELKEVEKALKLDPGNTVLLEQRQTLLNEAISATSEKLEILRTAEEQVQQQFERGEVSEAQYRALQREIIRTEAELRELEEAADDSTSTMDRVGEVAAEIGEKSEALGKKFLPVTAAIAGIGVASLAAFNEVDEGYDTIITKTGATGEVLEGLQDSMDTVFTSLPIDAAVAGTAIGEVNTRFGETGKVLEEVSETFIQFAEINETDLNTAIGTTDKIMEQWSIDVSETGNVLGILTSKAQATGISVDTLMNTVQQNGAVFKDMGLDLGQSISLLAEFEKNGVNAETAMAGLKKAVQTATAQGKTSDEALKETIGRIKNAKTETEAMQIATELFGKKGAAEMTKAIREGRFSIEDLSGSLEEYETVVADTFNATLDPPDQAKLALNNLQLAGAELGNSLMATFTPILDRTVEKVKSFTNWFKNLNDSQKETIVKIGLLIAAIGPALIVFGKISTGVSKVIPIFSKMSSAFKAAGGAGKGLWAVLIANPIASILIAVAAFIAAFALMYSKCEWFREMVNKAFADIKAAVAETIEKIKPILQELLQKFLDLMQNLKPAIQFLITFVMALIAGVLSALAPVIRSVGDAIDFISNIISAFIALFKGDFDGFTEHLKAALKNVINFVMNIIKGVINFIITFFKSFGLDVKRIFLNIWNSIASIFLGVGKWFTARFSEAYTGIKNAFGNISSFFTGIWDRIKSAFKKIGTNAGEAVAGAFKNVINGVLSTVEKTINNAIGFINGAISVINKLPGVQVGKVGKVNLPQLAKGGILRNGQAIMAEAGPELIQMVGGEAVVTPLTSSARNTALETAAGGNKSGIGYQQNLYITSQKELSPYEVARQTRNANRQMVLQLQGGTG